MLFETAVFQPLLFVLWLLAMVYGITVHEFMHALVATILGDRTPEDQGRLTLNPLAHLDLRGFLFLLVLGFGWGRPVEFNPYNLRAQRWGPVVIALSGPMVNLFSAALFALVLRATSAQLGADNFLILFLQQLVILNVILGIFNFLPIPPLDGSRLLAALLPDRFASWKIAIERYGILVLLGIILVDLLTHASLFSGLFVTVLHGVEQLFGISLL